MQIIFTLIVKYKLEFMFENVKITLYEVIFYKKDNTENWLNKVYIKNKNEYS